MKRHALRKTGSPWLVTICLLMTVTVQMAAPGTVMAAITWSQRARLEPTAGTGFGEFNSPYGVAVDSSGNVYVADRDNHRIQKLTIASNTWSEWKKAGGGSGSGLGEFNYPRGVAVDSAGNIYVADSNNHRIQKLTIASNTWSEWKKAGGGSGLGLGEFNGPQGVAVDGDGNIYIADTGNNRIQKLTISTSTWSEWGRAGGLSGPFLGQFNEPTGVALDGSGNIYVADWLNHRIQKLTIATSIWSEWAKVGGGSGSGLGEFDSPYGVALDSSGNIYVSELFNHRVQKLDIVTSTWTEWTKAGGGPGFELGEFYYPQGMAVDGSGNIYVAERANQRIQKLTVATSVWSSWGHPRDTLAQGSGLGEFAIPFGVAADISGNIYVADTGNHRIQKLTIASNTWIEWVKAGGGSGSGLGEFNSPYGVAVDRDGNVYVADYGNHRIQKLTIATNTWSEWKKAGGGSGSDLGEFNRPFGVTADSVGNIYVADTYNHRIQKLTIATNTWSEWKKAAGGSGSGPGEFYYPCGVAVDSGGNIYVADYSNHRVQKLTIATNTWSEWKKAGGGSGSGLGEFNEPAGVAVDGSGNVYVADSTNQRIQRLTIATNTWSEWKKAGGGSGSGLGEFNNPNGVAVGDGGKMYVVDTSNDRIQIASGFDFVAPTVGTSTITTSGFSSTGVTLNWTKATDSVSPQSALQYLAYSSTSNNITTVASMEAYGRPIGSYAYDIASVNVTSLLPSTLYYLNLIVRDEAGNKAAYTSTSATTAPPIEPEGEDKDSDSGQTSGATPGVSVNDVTQSGVTVTTKTTDGRTVTTISTGQQLLRKIEQGDYNQIITLSPGGNPDVVVGQLSGDLIKAMESKQAVIEIRTEIASYLLPAAQINIDALVSRLGQGVDLSSIKVEVQVSRASAETHKQAENSAKEGKFTIVAQPVEFKVTGTNGSRTVEVSRFRSYVERLVAVPPGVERSKVTTGIVLKPDGKVSHVPTRIEAIDGKSYARLKSLHNSAYAVVYHPVQFADVENHWAEAYVNEMGSRMIVSGVGGGSFEPNRSVTRAEFTTMAVRALGLRPEGQTQKYSDVQASDWYFEDVATASEYDLMRGYEDGTFMPGQAITREEAMVVVTRMMKIAGKDTSVTEADTSTELSQFSDSRDFSDWARQQAAAAMKSGIIAGSNGVARPKANITRAETATVITRMLQKAGLI